MRLFAITISVLILMIACRSKDDLKNVSIKPTTKISGDSLLLTWSFRNQTGRNLIIPTLITFQRLDSTDHSVYRVKRDQDSDGILKRIVVPYKYLRQVPDFKSDIALHEKIRKQHTSLSSGFFTESIYEYLNDPNECPQIVFVKADSEKQLVFMFKPGLRGKYKVGFASKQEMDGSPVEGIPRDRPKHGLALLKQMFSNGINGYSLEYGEFTIDSLEVAL